MSSQIVTSNEIPSGGTRRRNISKACEECRRRRAKCGGEHPRCSRCVARGAECRYTAEPDGRRPAPKSYVDLLRNRIDLLERVLHANSIDIESGIARLLAAEKRSTARSEQQMDQSTSTFASSDVTMSTLSEAFEGTFSLEESLNFDQDGEVRYFGPTSGRLEFRTDTADPTTAENTFPNGPVAPAQLRGRSRPETNMLLKTLAEESLITEELKSHLLELYFKWEQPWCWVVNEKIFRESETCGGKYHSSLLLNCILALGSRFSDRVEVRTDPNDPNTAGLLFLENAEILLHFDLKWPSITTIQSISIMGTMYIASGADAAGWLHQGMANRLALDMGLNLDAASLQASGLMSNEEIELRRQIYWALYCVDKLSASYTGRVCTMLDSQGVVDLPKVSPLCSENQVKFRCATIAVCRTLEKILSNLYAPKSRLSRFNRSAFLENMLLELRTWFYDLPSDIRIDRTTSSAVIPQVYTLHMVYHTSVILLTKPYLLWQQADKETSSSLKEASTETKEVIFSKASAECFGSALEICVTARKYMQVFGSFRLSPLSATHCTLSAALILLRARKGGSESQGSTLNHSLGRCLQVLSELSVSWTPAKRIHDNIATLCKHRHIDGQSLNYHLHRNSLRDGQEDKPVLEQGDVVDVRDSNENHGVAQNLSISFGLHDDTDQDLARYNFENRPFSDFVDLDDDLNMLGEPFLGNGALEFPFIDNLPMDYENFDSLNKLQFDLMR